MEEITRLPEPLQGLVRPRDHRRVEAEEEARDCDGQRPDHDPVDHKTPDTAVGPCIRGDARRIARPRARDRLCESPHPTPRDPLREACRSVSQQWARSFQPGGRAWYSRSARVPSRFRIDAGWRLAEEGSCFGGGGPAKGLLGRLRPRRFRSSRTIPGWLRAQRHTRRPGSIRDRSLRIPCSGRGP